MSLLIQSEFRIYIAVALPSAVYCLTFEFMDPNFLKVVVIFERLMLFALHTVRKHELRNRPPHRGECAGFNQVIRTELAQLHENGMLVLDISGNVFFVPLPSVLSGLFPFPFSLPGSAMFYFHSLPSVVGYSHS